MFGARKWCPTSGSSEHPSDLEVLFHNPGLHPLMLIREKALPLERDSFAQSERDYLTTLLKNKCECKGLDKGGQRGGRLNCARF